MNAKVNRLALGMGVMLAALAGQAQAQPPAPSENATINLIRLLVQQGVLKKEQADALVRQAEAEAQQAQQARQTVAPAAAVAAVPGEVRVPYIPQVVRDQIRDEVKAEVMTQAKAENWAQPNAFPDWASRISFDGDVRLRYESRSFGNGNSNQITDFAELNDDGPYDVNPNTSSGLPPLLNTREDRDSLLRLRARFGLKAALSESWSAGIRIGTGSDNNPVSTTQTLGGGFGKKDLWLDQGYLTWKPSERLSLTGGRIANPFLSTDLLYSNDLNFDGVAAIFNQPLSRDVALFGTVGAFPVEYSRTPPRRTASTRKTATTSGSTARNWAPPGRSTRSTALPARWPTTASTISKGGVPALAGPGPEIRSVTPTAAVRPSCRRATRCSSCATSCPTRPTRRTRRTRSTSAWPRSSICST